MARSERPHVTIGEIEAPVVIGSDSYVIVRVPEGASAGGGQAPRDRTMARTAGERRTTAAGAGTAPRAQGRMARVYKLDAGKPVPVNVRVGISDGQRNG